MIKSEDKGNSIKSKLSKRNNSKNKPNNSIKWKFKNKNKPIPDNSLRLLKNL